MPYCHHCQIVQEVGRFCAECGAELQPRPPAGPVIEQKRGDTGVDRSVSQTVVVSPAGANDREALPYDYCPIDGVYLPRDRTFRCRRCGREHICKEHLDPDLHVCSECAAELQHDTLQAQIRAQEEAEEALRHAPVWQRIGIEMVTIPAGEFLYGEDKEPWHLPEYRMAKTPVTNAQYNAFVEATGQTPYRWEKGKIPRGKEDHPVVNVSWHDAQAFCAWAGCRLPTEQEWEKGARGTYGREYPWGDSWQNGRCNTREAGIDDTTPVGRYPNGASPYGLLDMAGNVQEWCENWFDTRQAFKVLRGGSWNIDQNGALSAACYRRTPDDHGIFIGFRCVVVP